LNHNRSIVFVGFAIYFTENMHTNIEIYQ